jgi:hypothetical protein
MDVLIKKRINFTSKSKRLIFLDFDPAMVVWDLGPFGVFFNNRGFSPPLLELEAYRGRIQIWTYEDQNHPKLVSRTFPQIFAPHFHNITQGYLLVTKLSMIWFRDCHVDTDFGIRMISLYCWAQIVGHKSTWFPYPWLHPMICLAFLVIYQNSYI